jgi:multiple sugar transport system permease protein/sn-glycerol 3-phosphate transport system permease protein
MPRLSDDVTLLPGGLAGRSRPTSARTDAAPLRAIAQAAKPYVYLSPFLVLLAVFTYWPLVQTVWLSFTSWNMMPGVEPEYVGLANYRDVMGSELFRAALRNTGFYLLLAIPVVVLLPLPAAIFIWSLGRSGEIYRTILFLPTMISFAATSVIWLWILAPIGGYGDALLSLAGIKLPSLLSQRDTAPWVVFGVAAWKVFGFNVLFYLAGLGRIDARLIHAMRIDGAGDGTIVRRLIWPLMGPTTLFVAVVTMTLMLPQLFTPIDVMTHGGPGNATTNLFYVTYQYVFSSFNVGYGAAATTILYIVMFAIALFKFTVLDRLVHYR